MRGSQDPSSCNPRRGAGFYIFTYSFTHLYAFHALHESYRSLPLLPILIEHGPQRTHAIVHEVRFPKCLFVLLSRSESDAAVTVQDV